MKKILVSLSAALIALSISAQQQPANKFAVEVQGSVGYSLMSDFGEISGGITGVIGVEGIYKFNNWLGLGLGLDYYHLTSDMYNNQTLVFSDLQIPLLLHFDVSKHFGLFAGLNTNILLGAKRKYSGNDVSGSENVKEYYKSATFQVPVGIKFTFNSPCSLSLHYDIPVSKVYAKDLVDQTPRISPILLTFGYRFDL